MYFKNANCTIGSKDPAQEGKVLQECATIKRERGEHHRPAQSPVSPDLMRVSYLASLCSGGQNLTALSAAAGENLAAVSSSHSLAEAMNLGTVALSGLIGTLHSVHLLYDETLCSAASFGRSNT